MKTGKKNKTNNFSSFHGHHAVFPEGIEGLLLNHYNVEQKTQMDSAKETKITIFDFARHHGGFLEGIEELLLNYYNVQKSRKWMKVGLYRWNMV